MDKKKLKYWIKKGSTVAFVTLLLHVIGYLGIYPEIFNISSCELSCIDMHRSACWISLIIAASLAIILVKGFGLTLNLKTYKEEV